MSCLANSSLDSALSLPSTAHRLSRSVSASCCLSRIISPSLATLTRSIVASRSETWFFCAVIDDAQLACAAASSDTRCCSEATSPEVVGSECSDTGVKACVKELRSGAGQRKIWESNGSHHALHLAACAVELLGEIAYPVPTLALDLFELVPRHLHAVLALEQLLVLGLQLAVDRLDSAKVGRLPTQLVAEDVARRPGRPFSVCRACILHTVGRAPLPRLEQLAHQPVHLGVQLVRLRAVRLELVALPLERSDARVQGGRK